MKYVVVSHLRGPFSTHATKEDAIEQAMFLHAATRIEYSVVEQ